MTSFPLADILSVTTERLVSRNTPPIDGVCRLVHHVTGRDASRGAYIHGPKLLAAADEARAELLQQHPQLADVTPPDGIDNADLYLWLLHQEAIHGESLPVSPAPVLAKAVAEFGDSLAALNTTLDAFAAVLETPAPEQP